MFWGLDTTDGGIREADGGKTYRRDRSRDSSDPSGHRPPQGREVIMSDQPTIAQSVVRLDPSELGTAARVLAEASTEDPIHLWAMPRAATRLADAPRFFP